MVEHDERHGERGHDAPAVRLSEVIAPLPEPRPHPPLGDLHSDAGALIEHLLLNAMSSIVGAAATLRENWPAMSDDRRAQLLERMEANAMRVGVALRHVGAGDTVEALQLLRPTVSRPTSTPAPAPSVETEIEGVAARGGDPV